MRGSFLYKIAKKCEHPGDSRLFKGINFFFCQAMVMRGLQLAQKLKKDHPGKQLLLFPTNSAGDATFYVMFKKYFLQHIGMQEKDTLLLCSAYVEKLLAACGVTDVLPLEAPAIAALSMACHFYGPSRTGIISIYAFFIYDHGNIRNKEFTPGRICYPYDANAIQAELRQAKCRPGRTVLLSPYEKDITNKGETALTQQFWLELAQALKSAGFDVCTNCSGSESEPPVPGTERVFPRYADCEEFVTRAGAAVVLRSGFADFVSMTGGTLVTLFPSQVYWNRFRFWQEGKFANHEEIVYEDGAKDPAYRARLIAHIVEVVQRAKTD